MIMGFMELSTSSVGIALFAFMDLCGLGMLTIYFPAYLLSLQASNSLVGTILALYGFTQVISSPVIAHLATRFGRLNIFRLCLLLCSIGYLALGQTKDFTVIAALRVFLGCVKHTQNLLQAAISEKSSSPNEWATENGVSSPNLSSSSQSIPKKSHSDQPEGEASQPASSGSHPKSGQLFGFYQGMCSLAIVVGPPLGGYLMKNPTGFQTITTIVFTLYIAMIGLTFTPLCPIHNLPQDFSKSGGDKSDDNKQGFGSLLSGWRNVGSIVASLVFVRFLLCLVGHIWRGSYISIYSQLYGMDSIQIGYMVSYNAVVQLAVGFGIGPISQLLTTSYQQTFVALFAYSVTLFTISLHVPHTFLPTLVLSLSASTMLLKISVVQLSSEFIRRSIDPPDEKVNDSDYLSAMTLFQGYSGSGAAVARLVSPLLVGTMLDHVGILSPIMVSVALCGVVLSVILGADKLARPKIAGHRKKE